MLSAEMFFYLAVRGSGAGRFARLNDALVLDEQGRAGTSFMDVITISDWIVLGPNRLELELSPVGDGARAEVLLAAKAHGTVHTIHKYASIGEIPPEIEFHVGPPLEGASAEAPSLDQADEDRIRAVVLSLHAAISQGDIDAAMALLAPRVHRAAQRRGIGVAEAQTVQRRHLIALRDQAFSLLPISAGAITLTSVSRGTLVRAEVDGRAPICATVKDGPSKLQSSLPLTFQRGPDGWVIAR